MYDMLIGCLNGIGKITQDEWCICLQGDLQIGQVTDVMPTECPGQC